MSERQPNQGLGRYRGVILSITTFGTLFLLVMSINFFITLQFPSDISNLRVAAGERERLQLIRADLLALQYPAFDQDSDALIDRLRTNIEKFDLSLERFANGGAVTDNQGQPVYLRSLRHEIPALIAELRSLWAQYQKGLRLVVDDAPAPLADRLTSALIANDRYVPLIEPLLDQLTAEVEKKPNWKASILQFSFALGVILALAGFLVILVNFVGRLTASDLQLEAAQRELQEIMGTVSEGLFLLDRDAQIGSQYSKVLETLFERKNLAGLKLLDVLRDLVPEKTLQTTADYVEVLFQKHVKEKLITSLNPLNQVPIHLDDGKGGFITRHLEFHFKRVLDRDKQLLHILVTVDDITAQVNLAQELEESRQQAEEQMDLLVKMLHVEPRTLQKFLDRTDTSLIEVNETLKSRVGKRHRYKEVLNAVFPVIHGIKGEAALLGLDMFETKAHEFEDAIADLRNRPTLEGNDLLTLAVRLDQLMDVVASVRNMVDRLTGLSEAFARGEGGGENRMGELEPLVERLAQGQGKHVVVSQYGLSKLDLDEDSHEVIQDILIQLARNAVTHGIETPEIRERQGKSSVGHILLQFRHTDTGNRELIFRDDGRGISTDALREAAIRSGRYQADELADWDSRQLLGLLFESGFTTASEASRDAGRGVGMDVIKRRVTDLGGRLRLNTRPGRFCEWRIVLPRTLAGQRSNIVAATN